MVDAEVSELRNPASSEPAMAGVTGTPSYAGQSRKKAERGTPGE